MTEIKSINELLGMDLDIPDYQRPYKWTVQNIRDLLSDITNAIADAETHRTFKYRIGTIIFHKNANGRYDIVDGHQRAVSLTLLKHFIEPDYTCSILEKNFTNKTSQLNIHRNYNFIREWFSLESNDIKNSFIHALDEILEVVVICVDEVSEAFQLIDSQNTRGEQLEQHDILKAALMNFLPDSEKTVFAKIWDACSDMTGYVQMHFVSENNELRKSIFGDTWNNLPSNLWTDYLALEKSGDQQTGNYKISDIIDSNFTVEDDEGYIDDDVRVRFESIIDYPFFLLHVLRVLVEMKGIKSDEADTALTPELLDDKKLIENFTHVITHGVSSKGKISESTENKADFARDFIICLLRTRFLFDKYIIKREYANENSDGEWSLKSLYVSGSQSKKKPYYRNSRFIKTGEWDTTNDWRTNSNIMIQSALRVSYTSPKVMHWITRLLIWLNKHTANGDMPKYTAITEDIAKKAVKENFFDICKDGDFAMGINTPHIVFNYLDYLIWNKNRKKYDNFVFEFRNSVEHWYPQNPSEGTFAQWKDGVNQFGNLCIVQRNINSKFSNMSPEAKKSTFNDMISKGSLKLRIMSEMTENHGDKSASMYWKETAYKQHEEEMLSMLKEACGIE